MLGCLLAVVCTVLFDTLIKNGMNYLDLNAYIFNIYFVKYEQNHSSVRACAIIS